MDIHDENYEHDCEAHAAAHIEWLKTASPDDWHRTVLAFQWSEQYEPLYWIVQQDQCDRASALKIFWALCPEIEDAQAAQANRSEHWLSDNVIVEYIARRLHDQGYPRAEIAFDAEPMMLDDFARFQEAMRDCADPLWRPHPAMVRSIRGREVTLDRGFDQRCPDAFYSGGIELPPFYVVTPSMQVARSEFQAALLNLAGIGIAIGVIVFVDWSGVRAFLFAGLAILGGLWSASRVRASAAIVRSLIRQEYLVPSNGWAAVIAVIAIALGVLVAFALLKLPVLASIETVTGLGTMSARIFLGSVVIAVGWLIVWPTSTWLVYRRIFN